MIGRLTDMRPAFWIAVITSLLPVGLSAQLADNSAPVIRDEVWRAVVNELRERGVSERELPPSENFDLPAAPPARAGRRLQVASACWDEGRQRLQFRLECAVAGECLPFLAYLHTSRIQSADPDHPMRADREEQACRVVAGPRVTAQSALKGAAKSALQPASQLTMRPGDPAIAVFTGNGMRMTASVTCLDRGREGETVRVRGPDGNVFRARISGPARLEVSLNNAR